MVFIYQFQENPRYVRITNRIFQEIGRDLRATTSAITLAELMVLPFRQGNNALAKDLQNQILSYPKLQIIPVDAEIAGEAARLRAELPLRLPDCIHLASAQDANYFVTNDRRFEKVKRPKVAILDYIIK